jgi:hypothetical protein
VVHKQEETLKTSTTLEGFVFVQGSGSVSFDDISPPPNRARLETDVATKDRRATLRDAVVHKPEVSLKTSTTLEGRPQPQQSAPPPNRARSEMDVVAKYPRAILREAVVHNPEITLKTSTTFEGVPSYPPFSQPPPNRARFDTDVAAGFHRATLNVELEYSISAAAVVAPPTVASTACSTSKATVDQNVHEQKLCRTSGQHKAGLSIDGLRTVAFR